VARAPDPQIADLISKVSSDALNQTVYWLSENYWTRTSPSPEANQSAQWVADQFRSYGFTVENQVFRNDYCPNILATKLGATNNIVFVGSHLDCRSTTRDSLTLRAPGADDNGSGMAATLELARLIHATGMSFTSTIVIGAFCGEEQGLVGSQYAAQQYYNRGQAISTMFNADMIGYRCAASSTLTFDSRGVDPGLTQQCKNIVGDYVTGFPIGDNSGCCSDNQSFQNLGYKTVSFFECPGTNVANPNYHRSNDTYTTINIPQLTYVAKALYACALTEARPL